MTLWRQVLTLSIAVALAAGVAILVPRLHDAIAPSEGVILGLVVLLSAGLLHEYAARLARQDRTVKQLLLMAQGFSSLRDEVAELRERLDGVGAALAMAQPEKLRVGEQRRFEQVIASAEGRAASAEGAEQADAPAKEPGKPDGKTDGASLADLREALAEGRVDLYLQPIVTLPQRKRRAYECFSRLRSEEGFSLLPDQFIALAEREGFVTALDLNLLERAAQLVRKVQRDGEDFDFFCNISQQTLGQPGFLRKLTEILASNRAPARNLILELSQADLKAMSGPALQGLRQVIHLGCRLSMDRVSDLEMNADALAETRLCFVKLEAALLLDHLKPGAKLLRRLKAAGLQMVVEKVEDEAALKELLDYDIALAQGYLFSKPRLARPAA